MEETLLNILPPDVWRWLGRTMVFGALIVLWYWAEVNSEGENENFHNDP